MRPVAIFVPSAFRQSRLRSAIKAVPTTEADRRGASRRIVTPVPARISLCSPARLRALSPFR